jgi:hypothetical protein
VLARAGLLMKINLVAVERGMSPTAVSRREQRQLPSGNKRDISTTYLWHRHCAT